MKSKLIKTIALSLCLLSLPIIDSGIIMGTNGISRLLEVNAATEVTVDGIKYTVYEEYAETKAGTSSAYGNPGLTGDITIQSEVQGKPVTKIGDWSFTSTSITSVTMPDSIKEIGRQAFKSCNSLSSITLSNSLEIIGESGFMLCTSLQTIDLPDSLKVIDANAFYNDSALTNLDIPSGIEEIGDTVWYGCSSITGVVTLPDTIVYIGSQPFRGTSITGVNVAKFIEKQCSNNSVNYANATVPITVRDSEDIVGDLIFNEYKDGYAVSLIKSDSDTSPMVVPSTYKGKDVIFIPNGGFRGFKGSSIELPDTIETLRPFTFYFTKGMTSIKLPSNLKTIGRRAFYQSTALKEIDIPDTVTFIDEEAFYQCTALENVSIPESITEIPYGAFNGCTSLLDVNIPSSVTSINSSAFAGCTTLKSITLEGKPTIQTNSFNNCSSLEVLKADKSIVDGTKPSYLPSGTYYKVYLYDKSEDILATYLVKSGTDFREYANSIGTEWENMSGSGLISNVTSNLQFKLTGELVGSTIEKLQTPILNVSNENPSNRENVTISIQ